MTWKDYEEEIFNHFKSKYPESETTLNAKLNGRYSKVSRQIDILVEGYFAGSRIRLVVDGKYFKKKVDVKGVEEFIGMLSDCEAHRGILISQCGYSKAAIDRAHNDPGDIELDVLNFEELVGQQNFGGIPFSGEHGVIVSAPFGWVLEPSNGDNFLATLYQRGRILKTAIKHKEWMYVNVMGKDDAIRCIEDLSAVQLSETLSHYVATTSIFIPTIKRHKVAVKLRKLDRGMPNLLEYTGYVEFDNFIFFAVLISGVEQSQKNVKKLEEILRSVVPLMIISP